VVLDVGCQSSAGIPSERSGLDAIEQVTTTRPCNLPFVVGFSSDATALVYYLVVGAGGLGATLATRFEPRVPAEYDVALRMAASP